MALTLGNKIIAGSFKSGASWEVGDVGISALGIDESLNKRRYLNGQVISQTQFVQFTAFLKSRVSVYPSLATTEVNWQAAVTNSDLGQCGQFVIDDDAGTIRLPKVVNIQGLIDLTGLGGIKAESLPNITGELPLYCTVPVGDGFFYNEAKAGTLQGYNVSGSATIKVSASLSSSTYQDDAPVQQEAVQYPYFIQVAEGIENSVDVSREIELNNPFSLLDYKYSEYELSNASWLLSNGQWNSGAVYQSVYDLLLQIYNGTVTKAGVSVKLSTETYADTDFVLNTSDTTFRLPIKVKLPNSNGVAGNGMALGTTDGTHLNALANNSGLQYFGSGSGYGQAVGTTASGTTQSALKTVGVTTDPTKSGIEVKDDSSMYLYFYVGETIQDANIIAAASVLTKVANCIDKTVESDRETVVGWGMPDYSAGINVAFETNYTCPSAGFIFIAVNAYQRNYSITINGNVIGYNLLGGNSTGVDVATVLVSKNDVVLLSGGNNERHATFYPMKGVN